MANTKISEMTELAAAPASTDLVHIIDVSEAADADKNKKITVANLLGGLANLYAWELVGSYTLSAAALDQTLSSLTCDTDDRWKIEYNFLSASTAKSLRVRFNGDTATNYRDGGSYQVNDLIYGTYSETADQTSARVCFWTNTGATLAGKADLFLKSGSERSILGHCAVSDGVDNAEHHSSYRTFWTNTADEIASINIYTEGNVTGTVKIYKWASLI